MASKISVRLKNDRFDEILSANRQQAGKLVARTGRNAIAIMKSLMPVKTGAMRDSTEGEQGTLVFRIKIGVDYWQFQNYGTKYIAPKRFVEQSLELALKEFEESMAQFGKRRR